MQNVTDGLPLFQAHHGWLARVAEDRELVDVDWRNERSMNSARHEGILAKSASHLHLIALALRDESVEEMVSLLKAEPGEDYDKKPTASEPGVQAVEHVPVSDFARDSRPFQTSVTKDCRTRASAADVAGDVDPF